jgi:uncharacterized protein YecE (DUF72 family)
MEQIRIGCSGWVYRDWRGRFYPKDVPQSRWLEHYAKTFDTVELNATFYRLATQAAARRWAEQTPAGFAFAAKASRYLTHMKRLTDLDRGVKRYFDSIAPLAEANRLGPIVWQFPERFARDDERLARALECLPPGRHAFEFRHPSWFAPDVEALLRRHRVALVIGDHPERPFQSHARTTDWTLIRFHYGARGRRGNYADSELQEWARRLRRWARNTDVYAYFNNDWEAFAPRNALRLRELLGV